jgi:hypothetical protein
MELKAKKDGKGNIIITEDSFEMLLACLDNQKFVGEQPPNADAMSMNPNDYWRGQQDIQDVIDKYNRKCREILHQRCILETTHNGLSLLKKYERQEEPLEWSGEDIGKIYELFKDTKIKYEKPNNLIPLDGSEDIMCGTEPIGKTEDGWIACRPEDRTWLIEKALRYDGICLTISEDGKNNRPWKKEEILKIKKILNT